MKSCDTNACIEVEPSGGGVAIYNTRIPAFALPATRAEWLAFVAGVKNGEFDNLVPAIPPAAMVQAAAKAIHDRDCEDGPSCTATPTTWTRYHQYATAALAAAFAECEVTEHRWQDPNDQTWRQELWIWRPAVVVTPAQEETAT